MADICALNAGDFSGSTTTRYASVYASNTTSGVNFRGLSKSGRITTIVRAGVEYQILSYWGPSAGGASYAWIQISKNRGSWSTFILDGNRGTPSVACTDVDDVHYVFNCEADPNGYLHIWYNHHNTAVHYRISTAVVETIYANDTIAFGAERNMIGATDEDSVTYCTPFRDPGDNYLYLIYGNGVGSGNRQTHFIQYDHTGTPAWDAAPGTSTRGLLVDGETDNVSAYWTVPSFTDDWDGAGTGKMQWSYSWRDDTSSASNHDVSYVEWNGTSFTKIGGSSQTVPIRIGNADIIDAVATSNGLGTGTATASDSNGRPHISYFYGTSTVTHRHAYWNGSSWVKNDTGKEVAATSMPSADIVVRWSDNTAFLVTVRASDQQVVAWESDGTDYSTWTAFDMGFADANEVICGNHDPYVWYERQEYEMAAPRSATAPFLLNGLVLHFSLEDLLESRFHSSAAILTNVNSVSFSGGNAVFAAASDKQLTLPDHAEFPTGDATFFTQINLASKTVNRGIWGKWLTTGNQRTAALTYTQSVDRFQFLASNAGTATTSTLSADTFGSPSISTIYSILTQVDATNDLTGISVNDGTLDTTAHADAAGVHLFNSTDLLRIGRGASASTGVLMDGTIYTWGGWNRLLSAGEKTALHNGGTERPWNRYGLIAPSIWSHGATATVNCTGGDTPSVTVSAWGDLPMSESLTGTDAASYDLVDNADGTWTITRDSAISAGDEDVTLTLTNDAGTDAVDLTFSAAGAPGAPVNTVAPAVTGTEAYGKTLTSTTGTWTGHDSLAYQWYTNTTASTSGGAAISGATASTHVLTASQDDLYVYCVVEATNEEGSTTEPSNVVGPILGITVVIKPSPVFADVSSGYQDVRIINETVGDAGAGEEMPAPSTWETDSPVGDVDWTAFTLAVDAAAINRSNRAGATLISPNYVVLAAHAPGDNTGHTWMTSAGAEVTRTLGSTPDVDYWELGTGDLAIAKLSAPINNITPMPMILDCSKVAGKLGLAIEMDRHLNVFTIPAALDNTDEDCIISHSRASNGLESGDSGKPFVILIDGTAVMVITAMFTGSGSGPPWTGTGPNASHFVDEIFAITSEDGESPTVWDLQLSSGGRASSNATSLSSVFSSANFPYYF